MASPPPPLFLARLLGMAFGTLVDDLHDRLRARGYTDVRPSFGFILLEAAQARSTITDIAALMGGTKQAASKLVGTIRARGYVALTPSADDARAKVVTLTARGRTLMAAVEAIYAELEAEWAARIGATRLATLRKDLERAVRGRHGGALPALRPTR